MTDTTGTTTTKAAPGLAPAPGAMPPIHGLHHAAWRCRDAEETRHFYEDILGLKLVHIIVSDHVPSTGEYNPYCHLFFRFTDGSCIAFFDLGDGKGAESAADAPRWVNHIAFAVSTLAELEAAKARLEAHGVDVLGITDHGFIKSIYFFDPNGLRLELTCHMDTPAQTEGHAKTAHDDLKAWIAKHKTKA